MGLTKENFIIVFILMSIIGFITTYITKKNEIEPVFSGLLIGLAMGITAAILFWYFGR